MGATCNTPVTATKLGRPIVVHVVVADVWPLADVGCAPALAGITKAFAPASGALGFAVASGAGGSRAIQRAIIKREGSRFCCGIEAFLGIVARRTKGANFGVAVAAATKALVEIGAGVLGALIKIAYAWTKFVWAAEPCQPGHRACRRPAPMLEV
jgi:hypothetical protein